MLFFDELDKCSSTAKGEEIVNTLLHITDSTQNATIRDRYLAGLDLDLSCAMLVFSFNDESKISSVLLDRLQVVSTDEFSSTDQVNILKSYLLPKILADRGLAQDYVRLSPSACKEASTFCRRSGGVRVLRSALEQIITKVGIFETTHGDEDLTIPLRRSHVTQLRPGSFEVEEGAFSELFKLTQQQQEPLGMYS